MSHILEFTVEGLAGRKTAYSQTLDRHINVFFGENGNGKTSLLKILHSALSGRVDVLSRVRFTSASVNVYSIGYDKVFRRTFVADQDTRAQIILDSGEDISFFPNLVNQGVYYTPPGLDAKASQLKYYFKGPQTWSIDPQPSADFNGGFSDRYLPTSRVYQGPITTPQIQFSGNTLSEAQLDAYFAESIKHLWISYSADVGAAVSKVQQKGLADILQAVLSTSKVKNNKVADAQTAYDRVSAFLSRQQGLSKVLGSVKEFSKKYHADPQLQSIVRDIDIVEREIEHATAPRESLKRLIMTMFSRKTVHFGDKNIEIEMEDSHVKIELSALSSGEKQLLRIFIETLMAGESTILIDEPELSMHIDWQRALLKSMMQLNPKAQIIVATHSPEIMADLKEENIFRL